MSKATIKAAREYDAIQYQKSQPVLLKTTSAFQNGVNGYEKRFQIGRNTYSRLLKMLSSN